MRAERRATVVWQGDLIHGQGQVSSGSGVLHEQPVTWAARTERQDGKTSPEELIAAAHAACFAMALSNTLAQNGTEPRRLTVNAVCTFSDEAGGGPKVSTMDIEVTGDVPGLDERRFDDLVAQAEKGCPVSNALRGNVDIRVRSHLERQPQPTTS